MNRIAIVAARRTPQGRFLGGLAHRSAVELALAAGEAIFNDVGRELKSRVDRVILGNVLSAGQGMNPARQVGVRLSLPVSTLAYTVNMMCGSGLWAIMLACDAIRLGAARMVLCGGAESMSQAPYLLARAPGGLKLGDARLVDSILRDGLVDAFSHESMGVLVERLAMEYGLSRSQQDEYACLSQSRCAAAMERGAFARELVVLEELATDEHPRPNTTMVSLAGLVPAFAPTGTLTAGNASGLNDGAALVLVCDEAMAREHRLLPLAIIDHYGSVGCEPARMGLGPVEATRRLLQAASISVDEFDTIELNEAFAAQTLACMQELSLPIDRVNPDGGAIALGHPIGATGGRLVVHLAHRIAKGETRRGLATLCIGGGMGGAMSLVRPSAGE